MCIDVTLIGLLHLQCSIAIAQQYAASLLVVLSSHLNLISVDAAIDNPCVFEYLKCTSFSVATM